MLVVAIACVALLYRPVLKLQERLEDAELGKLPVMTRKASMRSEGSAKSATSRVKPRKSLAVPEEDEGVQSYSINGIGLKDASFHSSLKPYIQKCCR